MQFTTLLKKCLKKFNIVKKLLKNIFIMRKEDERNFKMTYKCHIGMVNHFYVAGSVHQVCKSL